jgi:subtilase family serine protease
MLEARVLLAFNGAQIQHAYGMDAVTLYDSNGNAYPGDGSGETIAIVDAYRELNIASDLAHFDSIYGLPDPPSFQEVYAQGTPAGNTSWGLEIALDVEYAHAMAPGANILLVEAQTNSTSNLYGAVDVARNYPGVATVSMSWGSSESPGQNASDFHFRTPSGHNGVSFFAASGDTGGQKIYPAMSPYVVSVGGTSLTTGSGGDWKSESAWSGSGGGQSSYSPELRYQFPVQSSGMRQGPDVSADANPSTGVDVYDTYGYSGVVVVGGTSAASPMWAGVIAVADEGFNLQGFDTVDSNRVHFGLYGLAYQYYPYYDGIDFHDIQSGSAGGHAATLGYDEATGLGTPSGYNLVPDLISYLSRAFIPGPATVETGGGLTGTESGTATSQLIVEGSASADAAPPVVATGLSVSTAETTVVSQTAPVPETATSGLPGPQDVAVTVQTASPDASTAFPVHSDAGSESGNPDVPFGTLNGDGDLL